MVSGKPYISVNSATRNAEKAPNERQSRLLWGFAKLNAKMMNTRELMITRDHNPYACIGSESLMRPDPFFLPCPSHDRHVRRGHGTGAAAGRPRGEGRASTGTRARGAQ